MTDSEETELDDTFGQSTELPPNISIASRWKQLVETCVDGQLLPFLGAGMSIKATLDPQEKPAQYGTEMPETKVLTNNILERIKSLGPFANQSWCHHEHVRITEALAKGGPNTFADAAQLFFDMHKGKENALYDSEAPLDMRLFLSIRPNPGHRYIAWLVRENVFSEVITTNYDCALESAFKESWGKAREESDIIHPISDHGSYRRDSYRRQRQHRRATVPVLRLYKINGCSDAYRDYKDKAGHPASEPGFLVITERHLQSFSKRQWARDLFRDRFRCRKLIFSGFGAEEPQIRFTALDVLEEFESLAQEESSGFCHCYMHVYYSKLQASELQIAKAAASPSPTPELAVFTGLDKMAFGHARNDDGLTANSFWECLYRHAIVRIISRNLTHSTVATWLNEHEGSHRISQSVIHGLHDRLEIPGDAPSSFPDWLHPFFEFTSSESHTLLLMDLVWRTQNLGSSDSTCPTGFYEDFQRPNSLAMSLLYLFHMLGIKASTIHREPDNFGFWFSLPIPSLGKNINEGYNRWVLVIEQEPARMPQLPEFPDRQSRQAICLTLQTPRTAADKRKHKARENSAATWRVLSFEALIEAASHEPPTLKLETRFRRALFSTSIPRSPTFYESHRTL